MAIDSKKCLIPDDITTQPTSVTNTAWGTALNFINIGNIVLFNGYLSTNTTTGLAGANIFNIPPSAVTFVPSTTGAVGTCCATYTYQSGTTRVTLSTQGNVMYVNGYLSTLACASKPANADITGHITGFYRI